MTIMDDRTEDTTDWTLEVAKAKRDADRAFLRPPNFDQTMMRAIEEDIEELTFHGDHTIKVRGRRAGKSQVGGELTQEQINEHLPQGWAWEALSRPIQVDNDVWRQEYSGTFADPVQPIDDGQPIPILEPRSFVMDRDEFRQYLCMCTPGRGDFFSRYQQGLRANRSAAAVWTETEST